MPVFDIALVGGPRAARQLESLKDNIEDIGSVSNKVLNTLEDWQKDVFESEGRAAGVRWPQYTGAESVYGDMKEIMIRSAGGSPVNPPLLRWAVGKERLYPSLTGEGNPRAGDTIRKEKSGGQDGWVFGTSVPYAAKHQYGQGRAPKEFGGFSIKQRMFINATPDLMADLKEILVEFVSID